MVLSNLNNFGMDQNYVHDIILQGLPKKLPGRFGYVLFLYVPASLLFFIIGSCLSFCITRFNSELIETVAKQVIAVERLGSGASPANISQFQATLKLWLIMGTRLCHILWLPNTNRLIF